MAVNVKLAWLLNLQVNKDNELLLELWKTRYHVEIVITDVISHTYII